MPDSSIDHLYCDIIDGRLGRRLLDFGEADAVLADELLRRDSGECERRQLSTLLVATLHRYSRGLPTVGRPLLRAFEIARLLRPQAAHDPLQRLFHDYFPMRSNPFTDVLTKHWNEFHIRLYRTLLVALIGCSPDEYAPQPEVPRSPRGLLETLDVAIDNEMTHDIALGALIRLAAAGAISPKANWLKDARVEKIRGVLSYLIYAGLSEQATKHCVAILFRLVSISDRSGADGEFVDAAKALGFAVDLTPAAITLSSRSGSRTIVAELTRPGQFDVQDLEKTDYSAAIADWADANRSATESQTETEK